MLSRFSKLPRAGKLFILARFLHAQQFIWPVTIAFMTSRFSLSSVGVMLFTLAISQVILEVPTGYLADKFSYKVSVGLGAIIGASGYILLISLIGPLIPVLVGVVWGLGAALQSGAIDALIYENVTHEEYEKTLLWETSSYQIGLIVSVATGGLLYVVYDGLPFIVQSITTALSAVPMLFIVEKHVRDNNFTESLKPSVLLQAVKKVLRNQKLRNLAVVVSIYYAVVDVWLEILTETKLIEVGLSADSRGLFISGIKVFNLLLFNYILLKIAKTPVRKVHFVMLSVIIFWPLAALVNSFELFVPIYIGLSVAPFIRSLITNPIIQKSVDKSLRATESSIVSFVSTIVGGAFILAAGFVIESFNSSVVFISLAGLSLVYVYPSLLKLVKAK